MLLANKAASHLGHTQKDEVGGPYVVCKSTSSVRMKQKRICRGRMKGTRINLS